MKQKSLGEYWQASTVEEWWTFANGPNKFDLQYPNLVENKYFSTQVTCESLSGQTGDRWRPCQFLVGSGQFVKIFK